MLAVSQNPGSLPMFIADERRYFELEGLRVRLLPCATGRRCLEHVLEGRAAAGTVADLPIAVAAHGTAGRFALVATINLNRSDTKIITRADSGIAGVAELSGRKVGTLPATTADYLLDAQLAAAGVASERVVRVALAPTDISAAMLGRRVDAVAVFEPYADEVLQALGAEGRSLALRPIYTQTWNLVVAGGAAAPPQAQVEALLRALARASRDIRSDAAMARRVLARRSEMREELVESSWSGLSFELRLDQSLMSLLEAQARWARRQRLVTGEQPNYLHVIDSRALRRVAPSAVTLIE